MTYPNTDDRAEADDHDTSGTEADGDGTSTAESEPHPPDSSRTPQSRSERSAISDALDVPEQPPKPDSTEHVLPDEDLVYPTFTFEDGTMAPDGSFDLSQSLDREDLRSWLEALSGGLASHDVGVETPTDTAIFGVGVGDVSMAFHPDEDHTGTLELTISLPAKLMTYSDDPDERQAGARGGEGFVPLEMLTSDRDPSSFRCYNWIDDPLE